MLPPDVSKRHCVFSSSSWLLHGIRLGARGSCFWFEASRMKVGDWILKTELAWMYIFLIVVQNLLFTFFLLFFLF